MSALTRAKAEIDAVKAQRSASLRRVREKAQQAAQANEHTIIAAASAFGVGKLEAKGTKIPTIKDVDPKLIYGAGGLVIAYMAKDARTKRIAQSVADGLIGAWAYTQGKAPSGSVSGYGEEIEEGEL